MLYNLSIMKENYLDTWEYYEQLGEMLKPPVRQSKAQKVKARMPVHNRGAKTIIPTYIKDKPNGNN